MAPSRPLFRKRDSNNDSVATIPAALPSPFVPTTATNPDSSSQPSSPHAISSDIEPHVGRAIDPNASDTEEEDKTSLEQYYLSKSPNDTKDIGTIFGKGIGLWESHGGTIHTYIIGETITGAAMLPRKRKRTQRSSTIFVQASTQRSATNSTTPVAPDTSLPSTPAPTLAPVTKLRTRDPAHLSTIFHQGSAAINPLGAYTRPFPRARQRHQAVSTTAPSEKRRRVVSGSFGTFDGAASRFDERPYRLFPGRAVEGRVHGEKGAGAKAMGKSSVWLRK